MELMKRVEINGKRVTLDDPIDRFPVTLEVLEIHTNQGIACGFQMAWVDGEFTDGTKFEVAAGAGVGSRWLTAKFGGRSFAMNIEEMVKALGAHVTRKEE